MLSRDCVPSLRNLGKCSFSSFTDTVHSSSSNSKAISEIYAQGQKVITENTRILQEIKHQQSSVHSAITVAKTELKKNEKKPRDFPKDQGPSKKLFKMLLNTEVDRLGIFMDILSSCREESTFLITIISHFMYVQFKQCFTT